MHWQELSESALEEQKLLIARELNRRSVVDSKGQLSELSDSFQEQISAFKSELGEILEELAAARRMAEAALAEDDTADQEPTDEQ